MGAPTQADWMVFQSEKRQAKVGVLYEYLCVGRQNMKDVAQKVLHDYNDQAGQRVSVITRCYGFEGHNQGKFSKWGVLPEDVEAFVKKYPNGCSYDGGKTMAEFLMARVQARKNVKSNNSTVQKKSVNTVQKTVENTTSDEEVNVEVVLAVLSAIITTVCMFLIERVIDFKWYVTIIFWIILFIIILSVICRMYEGE